MRKKPRDRKTLCASILFWHLRHSRRLVVHWIRKVDGFEHVGERGLRSALSATVLRSWPLLYQTAVVSRRRQSLVAHFRWIRCSLGCVVGCTCMVRSAWNTEKTTDLRAPGSAPRVHAPQGCYSCRWCLDVSRRVNVNCFSPLVRVVAVDLALWRLRVIRHWRMA